MKRGSLFRELFVSGTISAPSGSFYIANGQIIGPDGNTFIAKGIDLFPDQISTAGLLPSLFPGINMIRLAVQDFDSASALSSFISQMTALHVVVELEDHSVAGGNDNVPTGSDLASELSWYSSIATAFKGNPYVWFGSMNEPDDVDDEAAVTAQQVATYNTIRDTGNTNPIMMEQIGGFTSTNAGGLTPSSYSTMTNIVWDTHYYGWVSGYSTDPTTVAADLTAQIQNAQSIESADGLVPVIIGEYGISASGSGPADVNGTQVVTAAEASGYGSLAWAWNAGTDLLVSGDVALTAFGTQVAQYIALQSAVRIGSGSDTLALQVSEDAWNGNAQFTVSVDGTQIGGIETASASHSSGQTQTFSVLGDFAAGSHTVSVDFLNDAYGGTSTTDRNLYVTGATVDGSTVSGAVLNEYSQGPQTFSFLAPTGEPVTVGSGSDNLALQVSENAWNGNAQFTVSVDGAQIGGIETASASHASSQAQTFNVLGNFAVGSHTATVDFLNDAYGGTSTTDRNLYVTGATINGATISGAVLNESNQGPQSFSFSVPA
jgi:uncharacterized protein with FMN-binding domain